MPPLRRSKCVAACSDNDHETRVCYFLWRTEFGRGDPGSANRHDGLRETVLATIASRDWPRVTVANNKNLPLTTEPSDGLLILNARLAPTQANLAVIQSLQVAGSSAKVMCQGQLAAAFIPGQLPISEALAAADDESLLRYLQCDKLPAMAADLSLFHIPSDVIRIHLDSLAENLTVKRDRDGYRELAVGVYAAPGTSLGPYTVTNADCGPIVLERGVRIGPFVFLRGPLTIGQNSIVNEHASIKDNVSIGHTCKVGGEICNSIIEPYSNKQHAGYLGNSYVGSWVNLGTATTNSDLKNSYGEVHLDIDDHRTGTGHDLFRCGDRRLREDRHRL